MRIYLNSLLQIHSLLFHMDISQDTAHAEITVSRQDMHSVAFLPRG